MKILAHCPDCKTQLHEIVAITDADQAKTHIAPGKLLNAPGNDETWGWCPRCERTWSIVVSYDEVFPGRHEGDPK